MARADAQKIKLIGASDASAIECVGKAEAEMMRLKAAAYKQYGKAATLSLVLDALPKVCNSTATATLSLVLDALPKVCNSMARLLHSVLY